MTSLRQLEANRENAQRSTGPRTDQGKRVSRRNALRHGLAAETVIDILEDLDDYKAFEATIIGDYDARTAVERELVLRLASLLWRIRRATAIEADLLRIQAEMLRERRQEAEQGGESEQQPPYRALRAVILPPWARETGDSADETREGDDTSDETGDEANVVSAMDCLAEDTVDPIRTLTCQPR
jgi:hypothetical protein